MCQDTPPLTVWGGQKQNQLNLLNKKLYNRL
jgi:hypothetical protein